MTVAHDPQPRDRSGEPERRSTILPDAPGRQIPRRDPQSPAGRLPGSDTGSEGVPKRIAIVADSSSNLPDDLAQSLGIRVVPALLNFAGRSYRDGIDVTPGELYRWQRANKRIPTTAAPSVGDFARVYASASETSAGIVSIHPSLRLTATYTSALAASQLLDEIPIKVIDCGTVAMAAGFVVLEAARLAATGASLDAVVARAAEVAEKVHVLAAIGTLEYLRRGGRIGGAAALLGTVLRIHPILSIAQGQTEAVARPRSWARAEELVLDQMSREVDGNRVHVAIIHGDMPERALKLQQRVAERFDCAELLITEFTPVMGAHTGPGLLGVAYYAD
jgi:DegV family protein with EDD domain